MWLFSFFKHRDWQLRVVPEMEGTYSGLKVTLLNFPYRVDVNTGKRVQAYSGFNYDFLEEILDRQIGDWKRLRSQLLAGATKTFHIKLPKLDIFTVQLSGNIPPSERNFQSDLADALIDAFASQDIKPY